MQKTKIGKLPALIKVFDKAQNNIGEIKNFKHLIIPQNDSRDFATVINAALDCLEANKYKKKDGLYACNTENKRLNRELQNLQGQNKNLQKIFCNDNKIKSLNTKNNKKLFNLACDNNKLTSLNLKNNKKLQILACEKNQIVTGNCKISSSQIETLTT